MSSSVESSASFVAPVRRVVSSSGYGPGETWLDVLVAGAVGPAARAFVEGVEEGVNLGPAPRVPRLLEVLGPAVEDMRLLGTFSDGDEDSALLRAEDGRVLFVVVHADSARVYAWGADHATASALATAARGTLPRATVTSGDVPMIFWRGDGPRDPVTSDLRDVACPALGEVLDNYPSGVREELQRLVNLERPDAYGRIVLWYGPPGTGKTHAVRALAREWSERGASVEVVIDPERLMTSSYYLHEVLLSDRRAQRRRARRAAPDDEPAAGPPLRVVLLEDAAELFAAGCRQTAGFSRFLNLTDGILGQGSRVVFVLTTNEDIGRIDPALTRPGRCLQALEFVPFDADGAADWLASRGVEDDGPAQQRTLAELFALATCAPATVCSATARLGF